MKKLNWVIVFLLNIVTCGIYSLYLWFVTSDAHNTLAAKYGKAQIKSFIVALLLGIVTCGIYLIIWEYKYLKQMVEITQAKGLSPYISDNPILLLILLCVPILSVYIWIENHNLTVDGEDTAQPAA